MRNYTYAYDVAGRTRDGVIDNVTIRWAGNGAHAGNASLMRSYIDGTQLWNVYADARTFTVFFDDAWQVARSDYSTLAGSRAGDAAVAQLGEWLAANWAA